MNSDTLSIVNGVLFLIQAAVNIAYSRQLNNTPRQYETLITPGVYAFSIWILIYVLEGMLVITDIMYSQYSFYSEATKPQTLRSCFALTCVMNVVWVLLYVKHHVVGATIALLFLWIFLLVLYVYSKNSRCRHSSNTFYGPQFDYYEYLCSELPIAMYFAWVSGLLVTHFALSLQQSRQSFLPLSSYVVHLSILMILALVTLIYARDPIFSVVTVWYLAGIGLKRVLVPNEFNALCMSVHACAGEGALVLSVILLITVLMDLYSERDHHCPRSGMGLPVHESLATDYGSNH